MKFIDIPALAQLSRTLTHDGPECSVHTRIEAYSCKPINRDKKLFKSLEAAHGHEPPLPAFVEPEAAHATPFGPIDKQHSRKTLYLLIAALNVAFPDHDFSDVRVRPGQFSKEESGAEVLSALSTTLVNPARGAQTPCPRTYSAYPGTSPGFFPSSVPTSSSPTALPPSPNTPAIVSGTHPTLFHILDEAINLTDCEVFSYTPDIDSDPHADGYDSDEEWDVASVGDSDGSDDEEDHTFVFDLEFDDQKSDGEELAEGRQFKSPHRRMRRPFASASAPRSIPSGKTSPPVGIRMKRRGALLWSSHWFFLNRKLKRIMFITVCARTRGLNRWSDSEESELSDESSPISERFRGWEGSVGAGARALGLHSWV